MKPDYTYTDADRRSPERAEVPAEEARKREAALYAFRAAQGRSVTQEGD